MNQESINMVIEISKGQISNEEAQVVDARQLHTWLEVGRDFSTWINGKILQYDFTEGIDFIIVLESSPELGNVLHAKKDYLITLDMAKELAMVERNAKGKEARQYFIAAEKALHAARKPMSQLEILVESAMKLLEVEREQEKMKGNLKELKVVTSHMADEISELRAHVDVGVDYMSVGAFAILNKIKTTLEERKEIGGIASRICKDRGIKKERIPDRKYGSVGGYLKEVLEEAFGEYGMIA